MGAKTGISWTDATWNPVMGCSRVSEGCRNCYAEGIAYRFGKGKPTVYSGLTVLANGHSQWTGKIVETRKLLEPLSWKKPKRVFVNSMSDLFHENLSDDKIDSIFAVMALCGRHRFQILTKRPERMLDYMWTRSKSANYWKKAVPEGYTLEDFAGIKMLPFPLPNVWLGVSVELAKHKDRIDRLRDTPAVMRFLSLEPLLGNLGTLDLRGIGWVIVGGESGPHARPMPSAWADDIREQCEAAGVPFFFKQQGEWVDAGHSEFGKLPTGARKALRSDGSEWDLKDMPEDENADVTTMVRVGRKRAGDTLYGKTYHAFPTSK